MCRINKYALVAEKVAGYNTDLIDRMMNSSDNVANFIMDVLKSDRWPTERFMVFVLDAKLRILSFTDELAIGTVASAPVDVKEVMRFVLSMPKGAAWIAAHQHPSGDPAPSQPDIDLTKRLVQASEILGIKMLDHLVIGDGCYTSMRTEGYME